MIGKKSWKCSHCIRGAPRPDRQVVDAPYLSGRWIRTQSHGSQKGEVDCHKYKKPQEEGDGDRPTAIARACAPPQLVREQPCNRALGASMAAGGAHQPVEVIETQVLYRHAVHAAHLHGLFLAPNDNTLTSIQTR